MKLRIFKKSFAVDRLVRSVYPDLVAAEAAVVSGQDRIVIEWGTVLSGPRNVLISFKVFDIVAGGGSGIGNPTIEAFTGLNNFLIIISHSFSVPGACPRINIENINFRKPADFPSSQFVGGINLSASGACIVMRGCHFIRLNSPFLASSHRFTNPAQWISILGCLFYGNNNTIGSSAVTIGLKSTSGLIIADCAFEDNLGGDIIVTSAGELETDIGEVLLRNNDFRLQTNSLTNFSTLGRSVNLFNSPNAKIENCSWHNYSSNEGILHIKVSDSSYAENSITQCSFYDNHYNPNVSSGSSLHSIMNFTIGNSSYTSKPVVVTHSRIFPIVNPPMGVTAIVVNSVTGRTGEIEVSNCNTNLTGVNLSHIVQRLPSMSIQPRFVDEAAPNPDYHHRFDSQTIDTVSVLEATIDYDQHNNDRGSLRGMKNDIGFDEFDEFGGKIYLRNRNRVPDGSVNRGDMLQLRYVRKPGDIANIFVGFPADSPTSTPFGPLFLDLNKPIFVLQDMVAGANGASDLDIPISNNFSAGGVIRTQNITREALTGQVIFSDHFIDVTIK